MMSGMTMWAVAGLMMGAERSTGDPPLGVAWCERAVVVEVEVRSVVGVIVNGSPMPNARNGDEYNELRERLRGVSKTGDTGEPGDPGDTGDPGVRDLSVPKYLYANCDSEVDGNVEGGEDGGVKRTVGIVYVDPYIYTLGKGMCDKGEGRRRGIKMAGFQARAGASRARRKGRGALKPERHVTYSATELTVALGYGYQ